MGNHVTPDSPSPVHPSGKGMTSLTAHCGPVDFLVAAHYPLTSDLLRQDCPPMKEEEEDQGQQGPAVLARQAGRPGGSLLQYRLRSTCQLPGKPLSSRAEPDGPKLRPEAPEHGPEHGSIYAVRGDPGVWVRGRAAWGGEGEGRRSSVVSTAVFSGGRGHRRLGGGPGKMENRLLVWQLPLTASQ